MVATGHWLHATHGGGPPLCVERIANSLIDDQSGPARQRRSVWRTEARVHVHPSPCSGWNLTTGQVDSVPAGGEEYPGLRYSLSAWVFQESLLAEATRHFGRHDRPPSDGPAGRARQRPWTTFANRRWSGKAHRRQPADSTGGPTPFFSRATCPKPRVSRLATGRVGTTHGSGTSAYAMPWRTPSRRQCAVAPRRFRSTNHDDEFP